MNCRFLPLIIVSLTLLLSSSCKKKNYDNDPIPSEWLLPLAKGQVSPLSLTSIHDKYAYFEVSGEELGLSSTIPSSSPVPLTFTNIGPYAIETNDLVHEITFNECLIDMTLTNNFEVAIKAGTKVSVRSSASNEVLFNLVFPNDISEGQTQKFELDLSQKTVGNTIYVSVDSLTIDAYENKVFPQSLTFDLHFKKASVEELYVATNKSYQLIDTADFDGSTLDIDEWNDRITDSMANATLLFSANNGLPINLGFQIYFLDHNHQTIDSLFYPAVVASGAQYNGSEVTEATLTRFETNLNKSRLLRLKDATQVVYSLGLNSNGYDGSNVYVHKQQVIDIKIIGDIKLALKSFML